MGIKSKGTIVGPGNVDFVAGSTPPPGWIKANGAAVSRAAYAALFAAIGTTYGAGDGATTFNVPDMRGYFPRGFDDGRGVDAGRTMGSAQADAIVSHTHTIPISNNQSGGGNGQCSTTTTGYPGPVNSGTAGSTETRPKNVALLACIKY